MPGTPTDLGDATFGVYFKRDKDTEVITFELTVSAKDNSNDDLLLASVKDGKFSMWTSGGESLVWYREFRCRPLT